MISPPYSEETCVIILSLIEVEWQYLLPRNPIPLNKPARFLYGLKDEQVLYYVAFDLAKQLNGSDLEVRFFKR